jgi:predicted nucleotide-binding protein
VVSVAVSDRKRFAIGAQVRVKRPGVNGVVTQFDETPSALAEYWHTIRTAHGERREPGCNLELVPPPLTNSAIATQPRSAEQTRLLLAEIEDIRGMMPPRATIRHETSENQNWFGRVSAAIEKWNPSKSPLMREHLDLFFSNGHARETAHGLNKLLILLDQAQAELRLEITEMSNAAETPSQRRAWALLNAIYDRTHLDARPIDDVTKLDVGLTEEEARAAFNYLKDKGLLRTYEIPDAASINAAGIDAIENHQADEKRTPTPVEAADPTIGGKKVFIGHGRSLLWLKLRLFLVERLHLDCCEFAEESPAGIATTARLQSMLRESNFAFLLMTSEDTHADGTAHARENVVHEAGLFQGRLGFDRAIILLEEGCAEFSNIHGLGQIRFPAGHIEAAFEQIREVLKRERLISQA